MSPSLLEHLREFCYSFYPRLWQPAPVGREGRGLAPNIWRSAAQMAADTRFPPPSPFMYLSGFFLFFPPPL